MVEDKSKTPLQDMMAGKPLSVEMKGALAQFLAVQLLRGPAFFEHRERIVSAMVEGLQAQDFKPEGLATAGGDVEVARRKVLNAYLNRTNAFATMLTTSVKIASILGHMRWQVLRFGSPVLAYSDHPIVLWPAHLEQSPPFGRQGVGPMSAIEIRVPISPEAAILVTWVDRSDDSVVRLGHDAAGELNAFVIAQADRQWMHRPRTPPPVVSGEMFQPLSRLLEPGYGREAMIRSTRRATAQQFVERTKSRRHVRDVEVILDTPDDRA